MTRYLIGSLSLHLLLCALFVFSIISFAPMPVTENTSQHDIINAVVLGDTAKSNIIAPAQAINPPEKTSKAKASSTPFAKPAAIILENQKVAVKNKKVLPDKPDLQKLMSQDLLADIAQTVKKHKDKRKKIEAQFTKTLKEQAEKSLRQQLIAEDFKLAGDRVRHAQGQVDKYKALIVQAISSNWIVPPQVDRKLVLTLMIRLAPGGTVLDVQVMKSSSNTSLDQSARVAVLKASPLPVPTDSDSFAAFKQFILKVKPENILMD